MALISATTILTSICLFHMTLAYFFFVNPAAIADQALVWILGETLRIPETQTITHPTPTTSLLAIFLFLQGLSDLTILSLTTRGTLTPYWTTQIPTRMTLFGALGVLAYMAKPAPKPYVYHYDPSYHNYNPNYPDPNYPYSAKNNYGNDYAKGEGKGGGGNGLTVLHTRLFLTLALIEVLAWFWAWVTLGEEAGTSPPTPSSPSSSPNPNPSATSHTPPTTSPPSTPMTTTTTTAMKKKEKWMEEKKKEKWIEDAERKKRRRARTEGSNSVDDEEGEEERRGRTSVREWERR